MVSGTAVGWLVWKQIGWMGWGPIGRQVGCLGCIAGRQMGEKWFVFAVEVIGTQSLVGRV